MDIFFNVKLNGDIVVTFHNNKECILLEIPGFWDTPDWYKVQSIIRAFEPRYVYIRKY